MQIPITISYLLDNVNDTLGYHSRTLLFCFQVEVMNKADKSQKTETAFRLFDKNKDGYITREEFNKVDESSEIKSCLFHFQCSFTGFQEIKWQTNRGSFCQI